MRVRQSTNVQLRGFRVLDHEPTLIRVFIGAQNMVRTRFYP